MNSQPQELDSRLLQEAENLQNDELEPLLKLLIDLKLVDPPKNVDPPQPLDPLEATPMSLLDDRAYNQPKTLDCVPESDQPSTVPTVAATLFIPDDNGNPVVKPPPPPPGKFQPGEPDDQKHPSETSIDAFEQLQSLLVGAELTASRDLTAALEQKIASLEHQIYEPAALMNLLLPWVAELLTRKIAESREEVVRAIAPIIDQAIQSRGEQDRVSMSAAISPLIAAAISQQTTHSPEEVANAIAPTIGKAIKEQIRLEQDAMVDALYPIIGSTIAKYMAEAIQSINQQIENTLSPEGIQRKIRAKLQGVSEAELILKQAMPFTVQAIFLIHKASGLLIAEIQSVGDQSLESEMLAGMLTAIRSFANDCMAQAGTTSELDQIDYGGAKIILEVAGYCYLALVVQGEPPRSFMPKVRQTLSTLVKQNGNSLEAFDGDPDTIPPAVSTQLEALRDQFAGDRPAKTAKPPFILIGVLGLLALIGIPWGFYQYHQSVARHAESNTALALASTPALAVYRLDVTASRKTLTLTGRLPNPMLRWQAEQVVQRAAPDWTLDNKILAVEMPPDPVLAAAEVKRVTALLNQTDGTAVTTRYADGRVLVEGSLSQTIAASTITQAFAQIPGVRSVTNTVNVPPIQIPTRLYFNPASAVLQPADKGYKISRVIAFLQQYPNYTLRIIGQSDALTSQEKPSLALQRASAVRATLVSRGVAASRLQLETATSHSEPPNQPAWKRRSVAFEPIASATDTNLN
ncbi:MAG: BON domain-containing protein [Stenomitos rutilans HA7619-LM2]|nr:BON domain-containing protein [Stenomitos rutilans HA7619-LM2]